MPEDAEPEFHDEPLLPWLTHKRVQVLTVTLAAVSILGLSLYLSSITTPIAIGLVLAYVFNPIIRWLQDRGFSRLTAVIVFYSLFLFIVVLVLITILPPAVRQVGNLSGWVQARLDKNVGFTEKVREATDASNPVIEGIVEVVVDENAPADTAVQNAPSAPGNAPMSGPVVEDLTREGRQEAQPDNEPGEEDGGLLARVQNVIRENMDVVASRSVPVFRHALQQAGSAIKRIIAFLVQTVLVLIYTFFFMLGLEKAARAIKAYLPAKRKKRILTIWTRLDSAYANFFRGRGIICLISGVLTSVGLWLVGIDYWLIIGMTVGILGIVPFIGVTIGLVPSVLIAYTAPQPDGGWSAVIGVLIVFAVVQPIEPMLTPFILSRGTRLHPVTVLIALLAGGSLFGLLGAIIAVPLASTIKILLEEFVLPPLSEFAEEPNPLAEIHQEEHVPEEVRERLKELREIEAEIEEKYGHIAYEEEAEGEEESDSDSDESE